MRFLRLGRHDDEPLQVEVEPTESRDAGAADDDAGATGDDAGAAGDDAGAADPGAAAPVEPVEPGPAAAEAVEAVEPDVDVVDERRLAHGGPAESLARAEAAADAPGWPGGRAEDATGIATEPVAPADASPARARFVLWSDAAGESSDDPAAEGRTAALRFAGLHLRTGQHALARAELEALAGRGRLDEPGLLDLAEIRWRTGDLAGAGDAANALLARGSESPLALVIAAEAVAAVGRPGEARRLSSRALEAADGPLDLLFAGMPRSTIWPATPDEPEMVAGEPPRHRGRNRAGDTSGAPSTASEAFAGGRAALARGDATRAALLLGVAMRLAPEFAADVLRAVTGRDDQALLALVRGDALRLLGREAEALEAFDRARGRASAPGVASQRPSGPGLFDADPALADDDPA